MTDSTSAASSIRQEVRSYILNEFLPGEDPESLQDSTALISSGILDSISTAKLVAHLEESYNVRFKAHEVGAPKLDTVDRIVAVMEEKMKSS